MDEVQRAPNLLSYIQVAVDEDPAPGRFILTGSQNILLLIAGDLRLKAKDLARRVG